jgi:hypothetical protein
VSNLGRDIVPVLLKVSNFGRPVALWIGRLERKKGTVKSAVCLFVCLSVWVKWFIRVGVGVGNGVGVGDEVWVWV